MTDITELAQSLKAAAENAIGAHERLAAYPYGEIIDISQHEGEQIDIDITDLNEFNKEANPVNILALVEALEKAQQRIDELENDEVRQRLANAEHQLYMAELAKHNLKARRKAQFRKRRAAEKRIAELESFHTAYMEWSDKTAWVQTDKRFDVLKPWGKHRADVLKEYIQHLESRTVTVKLPDLRQVVSGDRYVWSDGVFNYSQDVKAELTAKGIKWEAE